MRALARPCFLVLALATCAVGCDSKKDAPAPSSSSSNARAASNASTSASALASASGGSVAQPATPALTEHALASDTPSASPTPSPSAAGGVSPAAEALAEQALALAEKMAVVVEQNQPDCEKLSAALEKFLAANAAQMKKMKEEGAKVVEANKAALEAKFGARMKAVTAKMMPAMQKCESNPSFMKVMRSMQ